MISKEKVFVFSSVHRWDDTRIFQRLCHSLAKYYNTELHAPASFTYGRHNGINVYGLPQWNKVSERRKIRKLLWERIRKSDADIFHFHDPELIFTALKIHYFLGKKVIYDVHESYKDAILSKTWIKPLLRTIISFTFNIFEKYASSKFDLIVVTTRLILAEFINYNRNSIIIANYPRLVQSEFISTSNRKIIYSGYITKIRGIDIIFESLRILKKRNIQFSFDLIGPFHDQYSEIIYKKYINEFNLKDEVNYLGYMNYEQIIECLKKASIGIVCYQPVPNHYLTFPNKIFEYMSAGVAVIASNFPLYKEVIHASKCGFTIDPTDPEVLADNLEKLLSDPGMLRIFQRNGWESVNSNYNWDVEEKKLLQSYKQIIGCP